MVISSFCFIFTFIIFCFYYTSYFLYLLFYFSYDDNSFSRGSNNYLKGKQSQIHNPLLPNLTIGTTKCEKRMIESAKYIKSTHKHNAQKFLQERYHYFGKNQYKQNSIEALHFVFSCLSGALINKKSCSPFSQNFQNLMKNLPKYYVPSQFPKLPEVFYFEHGLRSADQRILEYIKERDILDIGAFYGDSAYVLQNRTNQHIISYEFSPENVETFHQNAKLLNFNMTQHIIIPKGLSNEKSIMKVGNCHASNCNLKSRNGSQTVEISTVDEEMKNSSYKIGFVKIDAEGYTYKIIKGGFETFKRDRPVFAVSIYHNYEEMFGTYDLIDSLSNYYIEFQTQKKALDSFGELILFAYPNEIFPNGINQSNN